MISTITKDFFLKDGNMIFDYVEYPNWYGIDGVGFIWHGSWSDPDLEYNGELINATIVEDTMWERFREDCKEQGKTTEECDFDTYMRENSEYVYELIELAIEGM